MVISFFIIVIIWIYVGAKVGIEKDESRRFDSRKKSGERTDEIRQKDWIESVTDEDIERSIFDEIISSDAGSEIAEEIRWLLRDITWFNYDDFRTIWATRRHKGNMEFFQRIADFFRRLFRL